jgi:hypothetical protein
VPAPVVRGVRFVTIGERGCGDLVGCPQCGVPAEVEQRVVLGSTEGPVEHVKVVCLARHWFMLPAEQCPGAGRPAAPTGSEGSPRPLYHRRSAP